MTGKPTRRAHGPVKRGFTAVEVMAVATIIAILVLLAVPMFRERIEEARIKGCQDEMKSFATQQQLAYAETGFHFRLNDLDNTPEYDPTESGNIESPSGVPVAVWNRELTLNGLGTERHNLATPERWHGPYVSVRKSVYLDELVDNYDEELFHFEQAPAGHGGQSLGPIFLLTGEGSGDQGYDEFDAAADPPPSDRYPLDPWGNPYLFFGIGRMIPDETSEGPENGEFHDYLNCLIVSMGPNGMPGDGANIDYESYWREEPSDPNVARLGTGDDLVFEF